MTQALRVLSNIWPWFLLIFIAYFALISYDLLDMHYAQLDWWDQLYNISSTFLIGGLISFLFYFLVVYIPEQKKRRIIRTNLRKLYADIKHDILYQVILASEKGGRTDLSADSETVARLLTVDGFKAAFKDGREGQEGFYAFRNYIGYDVPEYREIVINLQLLSKQIGVCPSQLPDHG